MMNLYLKDISQNRENSTKTSDYTSHAALIMMERDYSENHEALKGFLLENERSSRPVINTMRRANQDIKAKRPKSHTGTPAKLIPKGRDLWLCFVGAARDLSVFCENAQLFEGSRPNRAHRESRKKEGFVLSGGPKPCLGKVLLVKLRLYMLRHA